MKKFSQYITELSTGKLVDYVAKASQDVGRRIEKAEPGAKPFKKILDRSGKIGRAKAHIQMKTSESADMCNVCGQTPCNCTSIDEQSLDEISQQLKDRYVARAVTAHSGYNMARRNTQGDEKEYFARKEKNTQKGISRAVGEKSLTKEESENINEISKKTLGSYVEKAAGSMARNNASGLAKKLGDPEKDKHFDKVFNRRVGIHAAIKRLTKEESENVNELRVSTLMRYNTKAHASSVKLGGAAARAMDNGDTESWAKNANKRDNRDKGILRSALKLRNKTTKQG